MRTQRHETDQRQFLKIHTSQSMLEVTDDHRVMARGSDGSQIPVEAHDMQPRIVTGIGLQRVERFEVECRRSEVVEPVFEDDAPVLVWSRTGRRFKGGRLEQAFAVKGGLCPVESFYNVSNGFFGDRRELQNTSSRRARSADAILSSFDQRRLARARSSAMSRPPAVAVHDMNV
jgi:hypothetical protein